MARSLAVLGRVAHVQRKYQEATEYLRESLNLFRELGEMLGIIRSLCGLAQVAWARESPGRAARLSSALWRGCVRHSGLLSQWLTSSNLTGAWATSVPAWASKNSPPRLQRGRRRR